MHTINYGQIINQRYFYARHYNLISQRPKKEMRRQFNNDSLVYSQNGIQEQENLLQDSMDLTESIHFSRKIINEPATIRTHKFTKASVHLDCQPNLMKYLNNDSLLGRENFSTKSLRKLDKDKQRFLACDPKVKQIFMKSVSRNQKVNELASLIQSERLAEYEKHLNQFQSELMGLADDMTNQRKNLQREIENIINMNKVMTSKLSELQKFLDEIKNQKPHPCSCRRQFSFSKTKSKDSPIHYLDRFQFAKTIISSMEELELKKVEEEEGFSAPEMAFVELIWSLKNKIQDEKLSISQGIIDRVASGPTLKQWIRQIDQKLGMNYRVSEFMQAEHLKDNQNIMEQFINVLKTDQQALIQNIKQSKDPSRELEILKTTAMTTFLQILQDQRRSYSKNQVIAYLGDLNRYLTLVEKKSVGVGEGEGLEDVISSEEVLLYIQEILS